MPNRQERKVRTKARKEVEIQQETLNTLLDEQSKLSKLEKAQNALQGLKDRKFKMYFFAPETGGHASGALIEIYTQAAIMRRQGFDVTILVESRDHVVPNFLDQDLQALPHKSVDNATFAVAPEDWLIIPEFLTTIMEQTKKLSCTRVVLAQNYDHIITSNLGGMTWKDLGMEYVLVTSERMKSFVEYYHGAKLYDIQVISLGVPDYFEPKRLKKPVISFFSRNGDDIKRISKLFYYKFPELQWVVFEDLRGKTGDFNAIPRSEFAKKIGESEILLFLDRIASFGQPAIEAMKSDTVVVALAPDVLPEYMEQQAGIWSADYYAIPELLGNAFKMLLADEFPEEIRENMKLVAAKHSPELAEASVVAAYSNFIAKREALLTEAVEIASKMEAQLAAEQPQASGVDTIENGIAGSVSSTAKITETTTTEA